MLNTCYMTLSVPPCLQISNFKYVIGVVSSGALAALFYGLLHLL